MDSKNAPNVNANGVVERFTAVQDEARALFERKNADYGNAFANYGSVGVLVRLGDKISRMASITRSSVTMVDDESLRDTLIDMHNYAAMAVMLLDAPPDALTSVPSSD